MKSNRPKTLQKHTGKADCPACLQLLKAGLVNLLGDEVPEMKPRKRK